MAQNKDKRLHLSANQIKGIQALLSSNTREKAAQKAGVTRNTMYRWLNDDLFLAELNKAKGQLIRHHLLTLQRATVDAVKTLTEICKDKKAPASARVAAAREILNNTLKSIELEDIEARIKAIEEQYIKK